MMGRTIKLLHKNSLFFSITLIFTGMLMCFGSLFPNPRCFMLLNSFHSKSLNVFFESITLFGDGTFSILLALIISVFFRKNRKLALLIICSYLFSGLFSQVLKAFISAPRPKEYFRLYPHYKYYLDTFAHCRVGYRSFPSGHSASAFALATVFSLYVRKKRLCIPLLMFAALIGYSRIYLAHHFLTDVIGGIIIGVVSGTLCVVLVKALNIKVPKKAIFRKRGKGEAPAGPVATARK